MNITAIKYSNAEQTMLLVTTDAGDVSCPWPCETYHAEYIAAWLSVEGNVIAPFKTKSELQGDVWQAIKAKRDATKIGGVLVDGNWFQTDADSRIQYLALKDTARDLLAAGGKMTDAIQVVAGTNLQWKTFANTFVPVTLQLVFDIVAAVKDLDAAAFANAETHRLAMLQAADPSAYDFSAGWPTAYQAS